MLETAVAIAVEIAVVGEPVARFGLAPSDVHAWRRGYGGSEIEGVHIGRDGVQIGRGQAERGHAGVWEAALDRVAHLLDRVAAEARAAGEPWGFGGAAGVVAVATGTLLPEDLASVGGGEEGGCGEQCE